MTTDIELDKDDTAAFMTSRSTDPKRPVLLYISKAQGGYLLEPLAYIAVTRERAEAIIQDIRTILDGLPK